jgi:hypothetical protein
MVFEIMLRVTRHFGRNKSKRNATFASVSSTVGGDRGR